MISISLSLGLFLETESGSLVSTPDLVQRKPSGKAGFWTLTTVGMGLKACSSNEGSLASLFETESLGPTESLGLRAGVGRGGGGGGQIEKKKKERKIINPKVKSLKKKDHAA